MDRIYAQVVNGIVNLIGGNDVGLPLNNHIAASIDITDIPESERPSTGHYYIIDGNGEGYFSETSPEPMSRPEPTPTLEEKVDVLGAMMVQLMLK